MLRKEQFYSQHSVSAFLLSSCAVSSRSSPSAGQRVERLLEKQNTSATGLKLLPTMHIGGRSPLSAYKVKYFANQTYPAKVLTAPQFAISYHFRAGNYQISAIVTDGGGNLSERPQLQQPFGTAR